jgi:hypothetical protein
MKKKSASQSAFLNLRLLIGAFLIVTGVFLALIGIGRFSAQAQQNSTNTGSVNLDLLPPGFDCASIESLGIDKQENLGAGLIMIACGRSTGGSAAVFGESSPLVQEMLAPLFGTTDVEEITGGETFSHVTQSETYTLANPDNPNQVVVTYNDSRTASSCYAGGSFSTNGGATFTRLTPSPFCSGHGTNFGDPVTLYNKPTSTFYGIFIATGCGGFGLGSWKSTDGGATWSAGACVHTGSSDDRESGWSDNTPASPFFGRMYVSWNDFATGGTLKVVYSTDNGATWTNQRTLAAPFIRDTQITGDVNGTVYVAGMSEGANGGLAGPRANKIYRSTDGGNTWTNTYSGPNFTPAGRANCTANPYFVCMYAPDTWRHMGWGEPAALNGVVSYVYTGHGAGTDPADVFYIRSTDSGVTFAAPVKLNTDATTRAQWQPNISVTPDGSLFSMWYDERETADNCQVGNPAVPCYRMYARQSTDNGATWLPDAAFSDVVSPLPGQPDGTVQPNYQGDYDYGSAILGQHVSSWVDGRVTISSQSQQDTFFDKQAAGGGGEIVLQARVKAQGNKHQVQLQWSPADGGTMNILRNGVVVATTPDDGQAPSNLGTHTGTFTYQVCETDSGDCSNEVEVVVP